MILCSAVLTIQSLPANAQPEIPVTLNTAATDPELTKLQQQIATAEKASNWQQAIDFMQQMARYYIDAKSFNKAIASLNNALRTAKTHAPEKLPELYADIGFCYSRSGHAVQSVAWSLKAAQTAERRQLKGRALGDIYNKVSMSFSDIRQYDSSFAYGKKAITAAEQSNDTDLILSTYFNLAIGQGDLGRNKEALQLLQEIVRKYPSNASDYQFVLNYIYTNIYLNLQQNEKAGLHFEKILQLDATAREQPEHIGLFLFTGVRYYTTIGQYGKAKPYILRREAMMKDHFNLLEKTKDEEFLFMADSAAGNYLSAINHYRSFTYWKDSLFSLDKAHQLNELQVAYNSEKKDHDITLLQKDGRLKDAHIRNQAITRNFIIGGALVLLLLLGIIYSRYQLKQRSNKALQAKQEEINRQNMLLKKLLEEKEWLLKEIHHRVKNNLQIVISLLNTQSAFLNNEDAIAAIRNSQHRMHAMSLIHQKLYQTDNLALIDMQWYIRELVGYLKECFDNSKGITFKLDTEPLELDVAQAVPIGLILNEAVSNAIKYAFPGNRSGNIHIGLNMQSDTLYRLRISDDGIGLSADFDIDEAASLGMSLMRGLSNQLDASFDVQRCNGTIVSVIFPGRQKLPTIQIPLKNQQ